jgi:hypothetical protein
LRNGPDKKGGGVTMNEQQEDIIQKLDDVREMMKDLVYINMSTAMLAFIHGTYDSDKAGEKEFYVELKKIFERYKKKWWQEGEEREMFENWGL